MALEKLLPEEIGGRGEDAVEEKLEYSYGLECAGGREGACFAPLPQNLCQHGRKHVEDAGLGRCAAKGGGWHFGCDGFVEVERLNEGLSGG